MGKDHGPVSPSPSPYHLFLTPYSLLHRLCPPVLEADKKQILTKGEAKKQKEEKKKAAKVASVPVTDQKVGKGQKKAVEPAVLPVMSTH